MSAFEYIIRRKLDDVNLLQKVDLDAILEDIKMRLGEKDLARIGNLGSGSWASVFWLSNRRKVVKVTHDPQDAQASAVVLKRPSKYLVKTYDVFALTPDKYTVYCIVNEKLTPLGRREELLIPVLLRLLKQSGQNHSITMETYDAIIKLLEKFRGRDWKSWLNSYLAAQHLNMDADSFMDFYKNMAEALDSRGIRWWDIKKANFMMRGHQIVISDLGAGTVTGAPKIPSLT